MVWIDKVTNAHWLLLVTTKEVAARMGEREVDWPVNYLPVLSCIN
jgi:hypothetical protein